MMTGTDEGVRRVGREVVRHVNAGDVRAGLHVTAAFDGSTLPPMELTRADGTVAPFRHGHPGVVRDCSMPEHVLVDWEGLEDAPISIGVGFAMDEEGRYPGLLRRDPGPASGEDVDAAVVRDP